MSRLAQDAADTLTGYEDNAARRARIVERWKQMHAAGRIPGPRRPTGPLETWSPPSLTEQQQKEHEQYVKDHGLPF